ncbi:SCO1/SenC [Opisthorchis viverrini]|uniref:SCO1/SenC n=1 Tax=Opisthorchis viverrini TaxID=6198 RepID=A0A1S8WS94_OPIVI|nr:SCO1/SenC [Opisthorchis viverrini]
MLALRATRILLSASSGAGPALRTGPSIANGYVLRNIASKPKFDYRWIQWGSFVTLAGFLAGGTMYMSQDLEKEKRRANRSFGRPAIGGDFNLIDHNGKPCSLASFRGKWVLLYFGFCHCPDICPEQLERLVEIGDRIEFSPNLVGLTGTKEEIDKVAKLYRIYYSAGPKDVDGDYIVDHTVVMYLLDPNGEFCTYYGQVKPVPEICRDILAKMAEFKG